MLSLYVLSLSLSLSPILVPTSCGTWFISGSSRRYVRTHQAIHPAIFFTCKYVFLNYLFLVAEITQPLLAATTVCPWGLHKDKPTTVCPCGHKPWLRHSENWHRRFKFQQIKYHHLCGSNPRNSGFAPALPGSGSSASPFHYLLTLQLPPDIHSRKDGWNFACCSWHTSCRSFLKY